MGTGSNSGSSTSHPTFLLVAWESSRGPKAMGPRAHVGDQEELLASDWFSSGHCGHLGSESSDEISSLFLLSVYLPFQ